MKTVVPNTVRRTPRVAYRAEHRAPSTATAPSRRWWVLGVLVVCLLIVMLDNTIMNVALKTIQDDLHATQGEMQWTVNAYSLAFAGLLFACGVLGDRFGRKRTLIIGIVVFGIASVFASTADSPSTLIAARALMGAGAAAIPAQTLSIITNVFDDSERGKALGIWAGFSGLAVAIGPVTGGFLLEHWWWGSVFLINVPFVVIGAVLIAAVAPESRRPDAAGGIDPLGIVLSVAGLVGLVYGIIRGGETTDWLRGDVLIPMVGGLVLLTAFWVVEWKGRHPAVDVTLFRNAGFSAATFAIALVMFGLFGLMFFASYYLQAIRGAAPLYAGILLTPAALGILITAPNTARLVRRFGTRAVCTTAMLVVAAGFAAFALVGQTTPTWAYESLLFGIGVGFGAVMAPATECMMAAVPRERAGAGAAVNNAIRMVGGSLGVAVLGSVLSVAYRQRLGDATDALPPAFRTGADESIGTTLAVLERVGGAIGRGAVPRPVGAVLPEIAQQARDAFVGSMHAAALVGAGAILLGAVIAVLWLPGREASVRSDDAAAEPLILVG
jgi:EmrB/QacA subfamily drug resistance transporter